MLNVENDSGHTLYVKTENATYGYGSKRIVGNHQDMADCIYNALSKIPKSISTQEELNSEHQNQISGNQKILNLKLNDLMAS